MSGQQADNASTTSQAQVLYNRLQTQIDARNRATLKPGTRVYYLPTFTVNDRGNGRTFFDSTVRRTASGIIVTTPDGPPVAFSSSALITYLSRGGKVYVAPGGRVPSFLKGRAPDEVIK